MNNIKNTRCCLGCNLRQEKKNLIRIVRTESGAVVDIAQKINGRGGYICKNAKCLNRIRKSNRLSRSLNIPVDEEIYAELEKMIGETA